MQNVIYKPREALPDLDLNEATALEVLNALSDTLTGEEDRGQYPHILFIGAWGDVGLSYQYARTLWRRFHAVFYGFDDGLAESLARQRGVVSVTRIQPRAKEEYADYSLRMCHRPELTWKPYPDAIVSDLERSAGLGPGVLKFAQIDDAQWDVRPILHADRWRLPASAYTEAACLLESAGIGDEPFTLFNPYSINSSLADHHWPLMEAARFFLAAQGRFPFVTVGKHWSWQRVMPEPFASREINLVGKTSSNEVVYALSDMAAEVVTTNNGLSHRCAQNGIPAVAILNQSSQGSLFERGLVGRGIEIVAFTAPFERFVQAYGVQG